MEFAVWRWNFAEVYTTISHGPKWKLLMHGTDIKFDGGACWKQWTNNQRNTYTSKIVYHCWIRTIISFRTKVGASYITYYHLSSYYHHQLSLPTTLLSSAFIYVILHDISVDGPSHLLRVLMYLACRIFGNIVYWNFELHHNVETSFVVLFAHDVTWIYWHIMLTQQRRRRKEDA